MENQYQNSVDFFKEKNLERPEKPSELILAAYELHTPENIGSIIRLAGNLNVAKVYFIHENFELKSSKFKRVAHSSIGHVDYEMVNASDFWRKIDADYSVIALETTTQSQNIFKFKFPKKSLIICGNERFGLPNDLINQCKYSVFIPIPGQTRSMNVSHAMTIAAFEWSRQHMAAEMSI